MERELESSLDSVLSGEVVETTTAEVQPETVPQGESEQTTTGEEAGTPPEARKEEPLDKPQFVPVAAVTAERQKRQQAERELQALRQQMQAPPQQRTEPTQQDDDPKPTRAQFESEDEWLDARDAWRDRDRSRAWAKQEQERAAQTYKQKTEGVFAEASKLPGFDFQAFARLPCPDAMADAILDSDVAPQVVHYLATNPDEAVRIASLSNARQSKEIARIEDKLAAQPEKKEEPEVKDKPRLPETLTTARNAKGQFDKTYSGPTPLTDLLK